MVYLAITNGKQVWSRQLRLGEGDADTQREIAALHALNMLRLYAVQQGNLPGGVPAEEALRASRRRQGSFFVPGAVPFGQIRFP